MACLLFLNYDLRKLGSSVAPRALRTVASVLELDDLRFCNFPAKFYLFFNFYPDTSVFVTKVRLLGFYILVEADSL